MFKSPGQVAILEIWFLMLNPRNREKTRKYKFGQNRRKWQIPENINSRCKVFLAVAKSRTLLWPSGWPKTTNPWRFMDLASHVSYLRSIISGDRREAREAPRLANFQTSWPFPQISTRLAQSQISRARLIFSGSGARDWRSRSGGLFSFYFLFWGSSRSAALRAVLLDS